VSIETVPFTKDGLLEKTPAHNYSEFRFRIYASHAFRVFRRLFEIDKDFFVSSLCSEPMVELSAAGASGSIFYVTRDDNFICKTVQHKEAEFLQKILPGKNILNSTAMLFLFRSSLFLLVSEFLYKTEYCSNVNNFLTSCFIS
jgi:hypothetical protein